MIVNQDSYDEQNWVSKL